MKVLSRTDLPVEEKVYLAASTMTMSERFGEVERLAERFGVSRPTLYSLREQVEEALREEFESVGSERGVRYVRVDRGQLERAAVALRTVGPGSIPVIVELLGLLYPGLTLSYGGVQGILAQAQDKAKEFNKRVELCALRSSALDEMFSQGKPILSGIDLDSGFVALLKLADGRSGAAWAGAIGEAKEQGFAPQMVVKDAGRGMDSGLDAQLPNVERRDDSFHAAYEMGKVLHRLERRAFSAIEEEEEQWRVTEQCRAAASAALRSEAQKLRRSAHRCEEAMALFDAFEGAMRSALEALEAFDVRTQRARGASRMRDELLDSAKRMLALPDPGARKVGRYLKNRTPGLVLYAVDLHTSLLELGQKWGQKPVHLASVLWQGAELLFYGRQRWTQEAQAQSLHDSFQQLRQSLDPERLTELLAAVESLFLRRHRASSALEGFHASLRPHLYVHKGVSQGFLELYRAYYNLHTTRSGRNKGTSAYERLTGQKVEDWLSLLGYPPSTASSRN